MSDKIFIDSNILIYYISDDKKKKAQAKNIIFSSDEIVISSQVINEFINVCLSKDLLNIEETISLSNDLMESLSFSLVRKSTINEALQIKKIYKYSYWDSLIISSSLENNCNILYSEDLHDGQIINEKLRVQNPF